MKLRVEYNNIILGSGIFWEGDSTETALIRNVVARDLAVKVAIDGKTRMDGLWKVSEVKDG